MRFLIQKPQVDNIDIDTLSVKHNYVFNLDVYYFNFESLNKFFISLNIKLIQKKIIKLFSIFFINKAA